MKIGLTYDLRTEYLAQGYSPEETAEFDSLETIEAIESNLNALGFLSERIGNIYQLTSALASGKRWDVVFNIAEGMHGISREAQIPALLDAYQIPYTFSGPVNLAIAHEKSLAKRIVRDQGVPTAPFIVVHSVADVASCRLPFPVFAKPIAEGTGKGITSASRVGSQGELEAICKTLLEKYSQPVLVESYLPGREFTVGIVGTGLQAKVLGVMEIILREGAEQDVYSFANKEFCEKRIEYRLVSDREAQQTSEVALRAWVALGCQDAGRIDVRSDAHNNPQFLEVNPLAGLHPTHSDLPIMMTLAGRSYQELISLIINATLNRLQLTPKAVLSQPLMSL